MFKRHIDTIVNNIFYDIVETDEVREQKEELRIHLAERLEEHMQRGLPADQALAAAKASLGDPEELTAGFQRKKHFQVEEVDDEYGVNINFRVSHLMTRLTPLAPFIYVLLGITQNTWMEWLYPLGITLPNWWIWGWVIIPMLPILGNAGGLTKITALSPFIYVLLGVFFGWWAWGWLIIPISGILFSGMGGQKKKKKKKKKRRVTIDMDYDIAEAPRDEDNDRKN